MYKFFERFHVVKTNTLCGVSKLVWHVTKGFLTNTYGILIQKYYLETSTVKLCFTYSAS